MNREIKFRAWDNVNNQMLDVQELNFEDCFYGGYTTVRTTMYSDYFDIREIPIMQYTGLHDKNGKEIYEGDIVRIIVNNNIEKICKVEFKNGIFGVMFSKNKDLTAFPHFCNTTFEIIGNIYDNPELLGGEDER